MHILRDADLLEARDYDSWTQFVNAAENDKSSLHHTQRSSHEKGYKARSFRGTENFTEAIELARKGWKEGADQISPIIARLLDRIANKIYRKEIRFRQRGPGRVHIGRYMEGHPQPWMVRMNSDIEQEQVRGQIIKIVFNIGASANVSTYVLFNRGAAVAALTDLLEKQGYRVEIHGVSLNGYDDKGYSRINFVMKRAQDAVEIEKIAFATAHASTLRRLGFSIRETMAPEVVEKLGYHAKASYGRSADIPEDERGDIYIPAAFSPDGTESWQSPAGMVKWITTLLQSYGIEIEEDK